MQLRENSLPLWLSKKKARATADWLHLVILTLPQCSPSSNVSLKLYLSDLFDRLVIILHNPDAPIRACIDGAFETRYKDLPYLEPESLLRIFRCGSNSISVLLQQEYPDYLLTVPSDELDWAFKHLMHSELDAYSKQRSVFSRFTGFECDAQFEQLA